MVASLMVLLITMALGSLVIITINNYSYGVSTLFKSDVERKATEAVKSLDLIMVSGSKSSNTIKLVVCNGVVKLEIVSIYVDNVPVGGSSITLEPLEIRVLEFKSPIKLSEGMVFQVKVVYEGGERVIYGYTYG